VKLILCAAFFAVAAVGCAASNPENVLRVRAANDLDCSTNAVHIVIIDDRTRSVRACGKRVTYVQSCDDAFSCTWIQNGEIHEAATDDSE
jgi:hypothetical protein